jgi:hypothetical protein
VVRAVEHLVTQDAVRLGMVADGDGDGSEVEPRDLLVGCG